MGALISTFDDLTIDVDAREVRLGGLVVVLTKREFDLLSFLASKPGEVFSTEALLREVWASDPEWQRSRTVSEHIYRLRRKLETDPADPQRFVTIRGSGY